MTSIQSSSERAPLPPRLSASSKQARSFYANGRPPWFTSTGTIKQPFIIGVSGGSASGKTSLVQKIIDQLQIRWVSIVSMDSFYKGLKAEHDPTNYNFDHPDAFDFDLMVDTLRRLRIGQSVEIPHYDFTTHSRSGSKRLYGADVIIFEGILAFYFEPLRNLMDLKIFVDEETDTRLIRRIRRDIKERGRSLQSIMDQYKKFVKPAFDEYIYPTKRFADVIVPRGASNVAAIELITEHIRNKLQAKGIVPELLVNPSVPAAIDQLPPNVVVVKQTKQIKLMHTIIRDKTSTRGDFAFYSDRLFRVLAETALSQLPFKEREVTTATGATFKGKQLDAKLCGVSVMRAGEAMEKALLEVCKAVPIGKILIQSVDKEPRLIYSQLPNDLADYKIFLMDAMLATGATTIMALRVLMDHQALEENIYFLNLIATPIGIAAVTSAFPKVKIVTTEIDPKLDDSLRIDPGAGNFGDRYFGTD